MVSFIYYSDLYKWLKEKNRILRSNFWKTIFKKFRTLEFVEKLLKLPIFCMTPQCKNRNSDPLIFK